MSHFHYKILLQSFQYEVQHIIIVFNQQNRIFIYFFILHQTVIRQYPRHRIHRLLLLFHLPGRTKRKFEHECVVYFVRHFQIQFPFIQSSQWFSQRQPDSNTFRLLHIRFHSVERSKYLFAHIFRNFLPVAYHTNSQTIIFLLQLHLYFFLRIFQCIIQQIADYLCDRLLINDRCHHFLRSLERQLLLLVLYSRFKTLTDFFQ